MSGPPPTPTALKILRGNPGKGRLNRTEPKPDPASLDPPSWLRGDRLATRIWQDEAPRLQVLGLLGTIDRLAFAALCERAALYQRTARTLRRSGGLIQTTTGGTMARPEVYISRSALEGLRRLMGAFGMTPADRSRLMAEPPSSLKQKSANAHAANRWAGLLR